ncbi:MAG: hypothetical protein DBX47_03355 [Clostridiales bacterium]|nr:MAG: hypothetical protein DBX47_03355 [Clostridiales bacterium]
MNNEETFSQFDIDIENIRITFILHGMDKNNVVNEISSFHKHSYFTLYVADGKQVFVQTHDKVYNLAPKDALILPPETEHRYAPENDAECFSVIFTFNKNQKEPNEDVYTPFSEFFKSLYCLQLKNQSELTSITQEIRRTFKEKNLAVLFRIKVCFSHLIFNLYDSLSFISNTHPVDKELSPETMIKYKNTNMRPFIIDAYMREHFRENITLEQMSQVMFLSTKQLGRIIKKTYGQTFYQRITNMRIEEAKQLLKNKNLTIEEIAYLVGYSTHTGFYKAFRQTTGKKPSEWRQPL